MAPIRRSLLFLATSVGFAADAYDLFVINVVTTILHSEYGSSAWSESLIKSSIMVGTMVGQVALGALADRVGRRPAFLSSMCLCIVCSVMSGLVPRAVHGVDGWAYVLLALCRLFLGVGIGGEYPLSATIMAESQPVRSAGRTPSRALAVIFSMQGIGTCVAPLVVWLLLRLGLPLDGVWRVALAVGALPFLATAPIRLRMAESGAFRRARKNQRPVAEWVATMLAAHWSPLISTAGAWFLLDVMFYGNGLFQANVIELLNLGSSGDSTRDKLDSVVLVALIVSAIGMPGYWVTIALVGDSLARLRAIQVGGFAVCTVLYGLMAISFDHMARSPGAFVAIYGLSFFFSNFGPNATTFIYPACYYPVEHRAACNGISAAAGKLGALLVAVAFRPMLDAYGPKPVFAACSAVAGLGGLVTVVFGPTRPAAVEPDEQLPEVLSDPLVVHGDGRDEARDEPER